MRVMMCGMTLGFRLQSRARSAPECMCTSQLIGCRYKHAHMHMHMILHRALSFTYAANMHFTYITVVICIGMKLRSLLHANNFIREILASVIWRHDVHTSTKPHAFKNS
jgi:hypothetical protein